MTRVGQNHIYIYGVHVVFLAGKSPNEQCIYAHTVQAIPTYTWYTVFSISVFN